jgi:hypothetical protein
MGTLLSLSNELLVNVFSSCDTIQSAATLSEVNKTMNSLWVTHNNQILTSILPNQIIGYKDAKDTAILEETWIKKNTELASDTSGRPRVHLCLSTLLRNAKLARSATAASNTLPGQEHLPSCHVAYYRMRKIVLGRLHPEAQLRHVMISTMNIFSEEDNNTLAELNKFLRREELEFNYHNVQFRTNVERKEPVRHEFTLLHGSVLADHFRYVYNVMQVWRGEICKIHKERMQESALAMEIDDKELQKSALAMDIDKKELQKSVLATETNGEKSVLAVKTNEEKLQKSVLAVKTNEEKLRKSALAMSTNGRKLMKSVAAANAAVDEFKKSTLPWKMDR